jgi:hypothetical protein
MKIKPKIAALIIVVLAFWLVIYLIDKGIHN